MKKKMEKKKRKKKKRRIERERFGLKPFAGVED